MTLPLRPDPLGPEPGPQQITAVIFDVGGVLAHPAPGQFSEEFFGGRDADSDHPWHRLERGELTIAQAMPLLVQGGSPGGAGGGGAAGAPPPRPPRPYTLDEEYVVLAEQLAEAGIKLALCTNTPRETAPLWQALYPWADVFDVVVRSCDIGARKPDTRMVRAALEQLGTAPEQTLFVDDLPANRASAGSLGVPTIDGGAPSAIARIRELTGVAAGARRRAVGQRGPRRPPVRNRGDRLLVDVLFAPEHNDDPYPLLRELRETSPLHQLAGNPIWYATRYDDCREVLRHPEFVKATEYMSVDFVTGEAVPPPPAGMVLPLAFIDPPQHTPIRRVMNTGFTRRRLDGWRPWLRGLAAEIVGKALSAPGTVDAIEAISYPIAQQVICDLVGIPTDARDDFRKLMRDAAVIFEPALPPDRTYEAITAIIEMTEFLTGIGDAHDGLLRDLLRQARADGDVSDQDVIANVTFLFFAGFETVAHLLSITLFLMSTHPDQYQLLTSAPEPATAAALAAQECCRYHSPVQTNSRVASRDLVLAGTTIPAGHAVVTMLGAANRDPATFPDPDRFDVTRPGPHPLTFGTGIHYCLGAQLAPLEATVLLESLVEAGVRTITPVRADWKHAIVLRGFDTLDLDFS